MAELTRQERILAAAQANFGAENVIAVPIDAPRIPLPDVQQTVLNALDLGNAVDPYDKKLADKKPPSAPNADDLVDPSDANRARVRSANGNPNTAKAYNPLPNPLHDYATYTYGLTLYMLTVDEFEQLQAADAEKLAVWVPKHVLISSAGRYNTLQAGNEVGRQAEFTDDFYFENLKMTTVIGLNNQTRGTNAIDISFTIIEPYGLTLLDRLIDTANGPAINSQNYLMQPYLLELDFFGANDLGDMSARIPDQQKRFPIKLNEFKIKAGTKGSEYAVRAVPFNHTALQESAVSTPVNLEVTASNIGNFFRASAKGQLRAGMGQKANDQRLETDAATQRYNESKASGDEPRYQRINQAAVQSVKYDTITPYNVDSYTDAINEWNILITKGVTINSNTIVGKLAEFPDEVEFEFSGFEECGEYHIENSSVVLPALTPRSQPLYGRKNTNTAAASQRTDGQTVTTSDAHLFNINAGTSIIDVINLVMRSSDYIKRQLVDVNGNPSFKDNTTVNFYKIIPQIVTLKYDKIRKRYATHTKYHIVYYSYYNAKHPNLPYMSPTTAVKEYNYIYTGKNIDILDFSIDFDVAYFNAVVALPGNVNAGNNQASLTEGNASTDKDRTNSTSESIVQPPINVISYDASSGATGVRTGEEHLIANALSSIYSNSRGDMINVKLKIIGDPNFIKQDDLYTTPGNNMPRDLVSANGTISMDYTDIFCWVTFLTPSDIDDATGLMRRAGDSKYATSKFSGFYKILTVESDFSRGRFEQTLQCVRMQVLTEAETSKQRAATTTAPDSRDAAIAVSESNPYVPKLGLDVGNVSNIEEQLKKKLADAPPVPGGGGAGSVIAPSVLATLNPRTLLPMTPFQQAAQENAIIKDAITPRRGAGFR